MFEPNTYIHRRIRLSQKVNTGIILLLGNDESPMNYADNTFPFRQDSTFLYYFGIDFPNLAAIIDIDNDLEIIFGDNFTIDDIVWMGSQPTITDRASKAGIDTVLPTKDLYTYMDAFTKAKRTIHILPPYRPENRLKLSQLLNCNTEAIAHKISTSLIKAVVSQREIKTDMEVTEIEQAIDISVDMHVAAIKMVRPGMMESEVAAKIHQVALAANANIGFPIIATKNGQTLHNHNHGNIVSKGDLFLVDAGAENSLHYNGDLSSTFPVDTHFTTLQKEIYAASLLAHQAAINMLEPNVPFKEAHLAACRSITDSMKALGLMKGDTNDAVTAGAHALFFPCGTGHQMGLDVHDMEDLGETWVGYNGEAKSTQFGIKSLRLAKPLKPGMVLTVEPGIYFIPELIDLWQSQRKFDDFINWKEVAKFRNFGGIRNEEDFLITKDGYQKLGKKKPKTIKEIEELRCS